MILYLGYLSDANITNGTLCRKIGSVFDKIQCKHQNSEKKNNSAGCRGRIAEITVPVDLRMDTEGDIKPDMWAKRA